MKKIFLSLLVVAAGGISVASAHGTFLPVAGFSGNSSFVMETALSGFSIGDKGSVAGHGATATHIFSSAGVQQNFISEQKHTVVVYTIDGILVKEIDKELFDATSLPSGLYIIHGGDKIEKLLQK